MFQNNTKTHRALRTVSIASLLAMGLALSGQANAASDCKGLERGACDAAAACGWVNSYERKDGRTVKAFCRTKAKRVAAKNSGKQAPQKPSQ